MGRRIGKILILLAITLALANAGCFARCVVEACQDSPPPCHSHDQGSTRHCPQQNQMKATAATAVALDWGAGFVLIEWPAEMTDAERFSSPAVSLANSVVIASAPLSLRI